MTSILVSEMESLGERLIRIGWRSSSFMCDLVELCVDFDESTEWALTGFPTAAHWIAHHLDIEVCTAREWIRIGRCLRDLPKIRAGFRDAVLSYSKVRALTRFATADNEAELFDLALKVPAGRLAKAIAGWSLKNDTAGAICERQQRERGLFASTEPDGSLQAVLRLPVLEGAKLLAAVDAGVMKHRSHASADASYPTLAQSRADALIRLLTEGPAQVETEVIVHVRADGTSLDDGTPIAGSIVETIAPKSFLRALIHDADRRPINGSGRRRHPTTRQKRVVKERDRSCVDCGSTEFGQYDHVPDYDITRHTVVDELFYRCGRCHRARHQGSGN